jgi:eukaryotic-like serine/threonine-protein kinase
MTPLPPRYTRARLLGEGGMAEVYTCVDELLGREVAVKILSARFCDDATMRERFLREARVAGSLGDHHHVVTVHDVGEWDGRPYIVMELAAGGSVAERLTSGTPPRPQALAWLAQAADALDAAHAAGLVHRDVKPANLLLDGAGAVRVTDFGVARDEDGSLTLTGEVLGTAGYLAPEQARGERCGPATDCYALAVVARELLTGRRDGVLPGAAEGVASKALAERPEARFASATAFVDALGVALGAPASPRPTALTRALTGSRRRPSPRWRRRLAGASIVVAAVALAVASGVATYLIAVPSGSEPAAAPRPTTCTMSPAGHDANVVVRGVHARGYCRTLAARLSTDSDAWSFRAGRLIHAPDHGAADVRPVCHFRDKRMQVRVLDSGTQRIGRGVCLGHVTGDWSGANIA